MASSENSGSGSQRNADSATEKTFVGTTEPQPTVVPGDEMANPHPSDAETTAPDPQGTLIPDDGPQPTLVPDSGRPALQETMVPGITGADRRKSGEVDASEQHTLDSDIGSADHRIIDNRIKIGEYVVLGELGRGGMGVVYRAQHRTLRREVALKMILSGQHAGPQAIERFMIEARAVAQLQHPNIVQIFDIGEADDLPYFTLEFVEGKSLDAQLGGEPQDPRFCAQIVEKLALAMQYAHDHNILHRDLKPANVLMTTSGDPKITDFGLAKEVDDENASGSTRTGTIMGSPSYMPPEQATGQIHEVGPHSDQYSLGALLYEMLTGRPPFVSPRPLDTIQMVVNKEPVNPRQLQPTIPVDLETICLKTLQKDASNRYSSCQTLAEDLRRYLNGEPILARPISAPERLWRWCRRNPFVAVSVTAIALLITATAVISTWSYLKVSAQAVVIEAERDYARRQKDIAVEQEQLAKASEQLALDRERQAREQSALALDSMQIVIRDIDNVLRGEVGTSELRKKILTTMADQWEKLELELTGSEGQSYQEGEAIPTLMVTQARIADALNEVGDYGRADEIMERVEQLARTRLEIKNRSDTSRSNLANLLTERAPIRKRVSGDPAEAIAKLEEAIALLSEIKSDPRPEEGSPGASNLDAALGYAHQSLGVEYLSQGNLPATAEQFQNSMEMRQRIVDSIRSEDGFDELDDNQKDQKTYAKQLDLDQSKLGLAYILVRMGDMETAVPLYEEAIAGRRDIVERQPKFIVLKRYLSGFLGNYGTSWLWLDDPEKAETLLAESLALAEEMYAADSKNAAFADSLATAAYQMGTLRDVQGNPDEARLHFERSLELRKKLTEISPDEKNKRLLLLSLARCGDISEAQAIADELGESTVENGELHLERARALAQIARQAESEEARTELLNVAMTALERSITEGYRDPFRVEAENDLDPLHELERFRSLVEKMRTAAAVAAGRRQE